MSARNEDWDGRRDRRSRHEVGIRGRGARGRREPPRATNNGGDTDAMELPFSSSLFAAASSLTPENVARYLPLRNHRKILFAAVCARNAVLVDFLLRDNAANCREEHNVFDERDKNGVNLLMCAAASGSPDILDAVLQHSPKKWWETGADDFGHTVLHYACSYLPSPELFSVLFRSAPPDDVFLDQMSPHGIVGPLQKVGGCTAKFLPWNCFACASSVSKEGFDAIEKYFFDLPSETFSSIRKSFFDWVNWKHGGPSAWSSSWHCFGSSSLITECFGALEVAFMVRSFGFLRWFPENSSRLLFGLGEHEKVVARARRKRVPSSWKMKSLVHQNLFHVAALSSPGAVQVLVERLLGDAREVGETRAIVKHMAGACDIFGITPLHAAIFSGNTENVKALLRLAEADPNTCIGAGISTGSLLFEIDGAFSRWSSVLDICGVSKSERKAVFAEAKKIFFNVCGPRNIFAHRHRTAKSPLLLATISQNEDMCNLLVDCGARIFPSAEEDPNVSDGDIGGGGTGEVCGFCRGIVASSGLAPELIPVSRSAELVRRLVSTAAKPNNESCSPLVTSTRHHVLPPAVVVEEKIAFSFDIFSWLQTVFLRPECLCSEFLCGDEEANIVVTENSKRIPRHPVLLSSSTARRRRESRNENENENDNNEEEDACPRLFCTGTTTTPSFVKELLLDRRSHTSPLHMACWLGNERVVEILSRATDFDPNGRCDIFPVPPLQFAVASGNVDCVFALLRYGANPFLDTKWGTRLGVSAFHPIVREACIHREEEMVVNFGRLVNSFGILGQSSNINIFLEKIVCYSGADSEFVQRVATHLRHLPLLGGSWQAINIFGETLRQTAAVDVDSSETEVESAESPNPRSQISRRAGEAVPAANRNGSSGDEEWLALTQQVVVDVEEEEEHNSSEVTAATPKQTCVICLCSPATIKSLPCKHKVLCLGCFLRLLDKDVREKSFRCCVCRSEIEKFANC